MGLLVSGDFELLSIEFILGDDLAADSILCVFLAWRDGKFMFLMNFCALASPSFSLRFNVFGGTANLTISLFSSFLSRCDHTRSVDVDAEVEVVAEVG